MIRSGWRQISGTVLWVLIGTTGGHGTLNDPFPMGYPMENFGTIVTAGGIAGRQPWTPAVLPADSADFGVAACGVDYFDAMNNLTDRSIRQGAIGIRLQPHRRLTFKSAYTHFSALDLYFEQKVGIGAGATLLPFVRLGIEFSYYRAGLRTDHSQRRSAATTGASLWIPWSFAALFLSCSDVPIRESEQLGLAPPMKLTIALHSAAHRFGAQGMRLDIQPDRPTRFGFFVGHELRLHHSLTLSAGLCADPLMLSVGVNVILPSFSAQAALVHHPTLGWSRGLGFEYVGQRRENRSGRAERRD